MIAGGITGALHVDVSPRFYKPILKVCWFRILYRGVHDLMGKPLDPL